MTVYLVGAGPGDPDLLTLRAARVLARADVVIHDRLASEEVLALAPRHARRINVGKRAGDSLQQHAINELLVTFGASHECVVRLKGGDPFVFGRGGEEAEALAAHGVAFEIVPGVSSAIAGPMAAGIPVTHRGVSAAFTVVTGHRRDGDDDATDWAALARCNHTLVILMGVERRGEIADALMAGGLQSSTPVAAIRWASTDRQEVVRGQLGELAELPVRSPATIVVGAVAALDLRWLAAEALSTVG
jgi:uroporphyrin-III C-methyltransferase